MHINIVHCRSSTLVTKNLNNYLIMFVKYIYHSPNQSQSSK